MSDGNDFDDEFVVVEKQTTEKKTIPTPRRKENEAEKEARTRKVIPRPRKDEGEKCSGVFRRALSEAFGMRTRARSVSLVYR